MTELEMETDATQAPERSRKPAHRPSRKHEMLQAAIKVFARKGYAESSVEDVAEEANVGPTAIYYHFGTKEELLHQSLAAVMDQFSEHVLRARTPDERADADVLRRVVRSGWDWWVTHPDEAVLIGRYSQGTTGQGLQLRAQWEERHRARAYDYIAGGSSPRGGRGARELQAVNTLRIRALLDVILATEDAALTGGALEGQPSDSLAAELAEVCVRLVAPTVGAVSPSAPEGGAGGRRRRDSRPRD